MIWYAGHWLFFSSVKQYTLSKKNNGPFGNFYVKYKLEQFLNLPHHTWTCIYDCYVELNETS